MKALASIFLLTVVAACSSSSNDANPASGSADIVTAPQVIQPTHATNTLRFANLFGTSTIDNQDGLTIGIREIGSDDRHHDDDHIWLTLETEHEGWAVFDLGITVFNLDQVVSTGHGTLKLTGKTMPSGVNPSETAEPELEWLPYEATIKYAMDADGTHVAETVEVTTPAGTQRRSRAEAPGEIILSKVNLGATGTASDGSVDAQLLNVSSETGANGVHPYLVVDTGSTDEPKRGVYNLGLDIAGIDAITFDSPTEMKLAGKHDVVANGTTTTQPVSYSAKLVINPDHTPGALTFSAL